jgi:enoyl-CoA hydratase
VLPYGVAMEMALTAQPITADAAHTYGLVSRIAEKGQALAVAIELAEIIARNAPLGVAASKQLVRASLDLTEAEFWEAQKPLMGEVFTSNDAKEGPRAFAEKRAPQWSGT